MNGNNNVTSGQMGLFTFITQTGVGTILLPLLLVREVGHDGWISLLITGSIAMLTSILILTLLKRYSDKAIYEINTLIFGKILGFIFNSLLILYVSLVSIGGLRIFSTYLALTVMPKTPSWFLLPFMTLPSLYLVWQGLKYVCRFKYCTIFAYVIIFIYIILISKDLRLSFLFPIGEAGIGPLLSSIKTSFFAFLGMELIVFFFPEITDKQNALKWHVVANLNSMLFFLVIVISSTTLFGENFLKIQTLPTFNMTRFFNAPVLERVDIYILSLWFVAMGCSIRAYIFAGYYSLQKVFKLKKTKSSYGIYFFLLVLLSRIPKDINITFVFLKIMNQIGLVVVMFIIGCLPLSFIRTKGVKKA